MNNSGIGQGPRQLKKFCGFFYLRQRDGRAQIVVQLVEDVHRLFVTEYMQKKAHRHNVDEPSRPILATISSRCAGNFISSERLLSLLPRKFSVGRTDSFPVS